MNKFTQILIVGLSLLCSHLSLAQRNYDILLQTAVITETDKIAVGSIARQMPAAYQYAGRYYFILQFDDVPDAALQKELRDRGVTLLEYLPNYAYWAAVSARTDLNKLPARGIILPKPQYKLTLPVYQQVIRSEGNGKSLVVHAFPFPSISTEELREEIAKSGITIEKNTGRYLQCKANAGEVLLLAAHPAILYLEEGPQELVAEDIAARSLHGVQALSEGPGSGLDGAGVVISTADDGIVVHPDLKNRVTHHLEVDGATHHSDMVLGILTGAGNLDPTAMGMAPGATVHLYDIRTDEHIEGAVANFEQYGVTITTTAYAEGCGGRYEGSARDIDDQVYHNPFLLHCFSAGNEADERCSDNYGHLLDEEGYSYGNITGGRKAAKNVVAVGNLYYNGELMRLSSRGPANDGRIKPDLCAFGQGQRSTYPDDAYQAGGGSSAAVPVVAGAAAMLTQLYKEERQVNTMPSDLLKPVMLNTAEDIGAPGPDFKHGWGRLQTERAAEIIRQNQYFRADIDHDGENIHKITIPEGALDFRIMLYWHDPAAGPIAGKALVNDLDLTVKTPAGSSVLPWVLSTSPQIDSINKPAYRGVDRVNNVEQVTIGFPQGGQYQVRVQGHLAPKGPQSYYIVYSYRRQAVQLTYPAGGESFTPGENQILRWESFGLAAPFDLEYRLQGRDWQPIATNLSPKLRYLNWQIPPDIHGLAEIRIHGGSHMSVSATPFSILGEPVFDFLHRDEQSAWMQWQPVKGADIYDVYKLGERYMEIIGTTEETRFLLQVDREQVNWYSVRARKSAGATGRRALAKRYLHLSCDVSTRLTIKFDAYPSETQWQIRNEEGLIVAKGGSYDKQRPNTEMEITSCLPNGCYELIVMDSYGDGICCFSGQGYYELSDEKGRVLASGGRFIREDRTSFCLESSAEPPPAEPLSLGIIDQQQVDCAGGTDGQVAVQAKGGRGVYTYLWSNGQSGPTLQNVAAGIYRVTVSDGFSSLVESIEVDEPASLMINFSVFSDDCQPQSPKEIVATVTGGTSPYDYRWSNGGRSPTITGLTAGEYTLTITDAVGCMITRSVSIETITSLKLNLEIQQPRCQGEANGQILATISGGRPPYRYSWNNGQTATSLTQLSPGAYRVTVTDANGCWIIGQATLLQPTPIQINGNITPVSDSGPGSIQLQISGGVPSYRYQWSDGASLANRTGLSAGDYSVTVTDNKGCLQSQGFKVPDERSGSEPDYCSTSGVLADKEWIQSVAINNNYFISGSNRGYQDYTDRPVSVFAGRRFDLRLERGRNTRSNLHFWSVWIDFNRNGKLDDTGELVFQSNSFQYVHQAQIQIPAGLSGQTRMRISMQWGTHPGPCDHPIWGEVEDFTLRFVQPQSVTAGRIMDLSSSGFSTPSAQQMRIMPNPTHRDFRLAYSGLPGGDGLLTLINGQGQVVRKWNWTEAGAQGEQHFNLPTGTVPGLYYLRLQIGQWYGVERLVVH